MKTNTNKNKLQKSRVIHNLALEAGYNGGAEYIENEPHLWKKSEDQIIKILQGEIEYYGGMSGGSPMIAGIHVQPYK